MLGSIKQLMDELLKPQAGPDSAEAKEQRLRLATAVLMMEIVSADFEAGEREIQRACELLAREFGLSVHEAQELAELGRAEMQEAVSMFEYTRLLDTALTQSDKVRMVEMLWHLAFVDGRLDKYEEYTMRRIADLLHISHRQLIQAKHKAMGKG